MINTKNYNFFSRRYIANLLKIIPCFFLCCIMSTLYSQELTSDASTLLLLHFNNSLNGVNGETPQSSQNLSYSNTHFRFGQGLDATHINSQLVYNSGYLNVDEGTFELWIRPTWNGNDNSTHHLMSFNGFALLKDGGNNLVMYINTIENSSQAWKHAIYNVTHWEENEWYHLAITWKDNEIRLYVNGIFVAGSTGNFTLDVPAYPTISFFSWHTGLESCQCYVDELRMSNTVRSAQEIYTSYFKGLNLNLTTFGARSLDTIKMYETWNVYLQRSGFWKVPQLYLTNGVDTINLSNEAVQWSVSDTSIIKITTEGMTAYNAGNASLIATFSEMTVTIPVQVKKAIKAPTYESNIDPFLVNPVQCAHDTIPVLIIAYIPTLDSINLDLPEIQWFPNLPSQTVAYEKAHILNINKQTKFILEEGSRFRGYSNPNALPYLGYKVVDYITLFETVPRSISVPGAPNTFVTDYNQIIKRFNGRHYVDDLGVKEIWILGIHTDEVGLVESNMSSATTGDISNSNRYQDDLPIYNQTYVMYNYNITRSHREAVHNHGHQVEAMSLHVNQLQDGNTNLFSRDFVGWNNGLFPKFRVGDTHHPPNADSDYDYYNTTPVLSDIMDWRPSGGVGTLINKDTYGNIPYNWPAQTGLFIPTDVPDEQSNWYLFWMQNIPGYGNIIPYGSRYMTNWWRFISDWDQNHGIGLHQATVEPDPDCVLPTTLVKLKAILGGAYFANGDTMSTALRTMGLIPAKCPYDTTVVLNPLPLNMVDWVRVDLVDTLTGDITYATQCACLLQNGAIQDISGDSIVTIAGFTNDFVSIRLNHRNHLKVRSRGIEITQGVPISFDFRSGTNLYIDPTIIGATFHNAGLPELLTGSRYALWPGDANSDGQVKYQGSANDRGLILTAIGGTNITNTLTGYHATDISLNGQVKYQGSGNDRGMVLSSIGGSVITKISKAHD